MGKQSLRCSDFDKLGLSNGHKQLASCEQLESGHEEEEEEEMTIDSGSFLDYGILVNPQYPNRLTRSTLSEFMAAAEDLPSECEKQIRFLRLLGVDTTIIALTPDVGFLMPLLRAMYPKKLVGTMDDFLWMRDALSLVVASLDDECFARRGFIAHNIGGVILPPASKSFPQSKVLPLLSTLCSDWEPGLYPVCRKDRNWLAEIYRDIPSKEVRALLERHLPEALACPGLGDFIFKTKVTSFVYARSSSLVNDWSGFLALLPGVICASLEASCTSCLVVAPLSRVSQLVKLIAGFMEYMGIRGVPIGCVNHGAAQEKLRIAVGTPDKVAPSKTQQLVLVETDALLSLGFEQQVEKLLCIPGVQVGLHAGTRSAAVDALVARLLPGEAFCPKAGGSLKHVDLYCVETDKKAARLYEIWRALVRLMPPHKMQIAVYCNTPESVRKLGGELDEMGVPVCLRHSGMCTNALKKVEAEFDTNRHELLVTDIFTPSSAMDVVLYDLPGTPEAFVERVLKDRNYVGKAKIVISVVSSCEERQLLADVAEQYQVVFQSLPAKLPQVYRRSVRPCR